MFNDRYFCLVPLVQERHVLFVTYARNIEQSLTIGDLAAEFPAEAEKGLKHYFLLARNNRPSDEIEFEVLSPEKRLEILATCARVLDLANDVDIKEINKICHGFVAADIACLCRMASEIADVSSIQQKGVPGQLKISSQNFLDSFRKIEISNLQRKNGDVQRAEPVKWDDRVLEESVIWVGESEKAIANIFKIARRCSPCIIFLDELEALFGNREFTGRLDRLVYVRPPNIEERKSIFRILANKKPKFSNGVDIDELAERTANFTGADIKGLVRRAALLAFQKFRKGDNEEKNIGQSDLLEALSNFNPSVGDSQLAKYQRFAESMRAEVNF
ncbi:388_t:CDS:2 [Acaulospora colombiana]|uniref:388_t:CDS:1 n=1 Tax=Acaulospora colombiana TaxID=27376 RepID=A0ACA9L7F1_9GLOM|nr:388_t:CDS:2 [Acaulospora colombiana]